MSNRTTPLTDELHRYLLEHSLREPEVLRALREETAGLEMSNMQIAPEQGQFMALLVRLIGARRCIEVGTFTGYSALACALAMPADGQLIALDVSEEWTAIARRYWQAAGVADRIDLRLGDARESLAAMLPDEAGTTDFIFVDADKTGYREYVELGLELLRPGGLLVLDNTLWGGSVADPADDDEDTRAIRAVNDTLHADERVDLSLVPIGDGLTLARKRG